MELDGFVPRRISDLLAEQMRIEPVISLHGPRSVGKLTVLRGFAEAVSGSVIDLDDVEVREAVQGNLAATARVGAPVCIDEYQRVPDVLDALKARLNREGSLPGTAVVTGSTRQDALPATSQALTGRLHSLVIWPLSEGELGGARDNLLEVLSGDVGAVVQAVPASATARSEYVDRVCSGGMPLALRRSGAARSRWFDDFVRASAERDAVELSKIRERQALADLLGYVAGQTGQLLNVTAAAEKIGVSRPTAEAHVRLLEDLFLIVRLPAWGKTLCSRMNAKPKVHVVDSGLAPAHRNRPDLAHGFRTLAGDIRRRGVTQAGVVAR
ncbi:MAG: AAA family ATPase [Cutibacterium granulosum]|nr:AAA family ATPase [Cutibacterium granulosum]